MIEIKFRGFDLDLKRWIYGGYHKHIKRQICPLGDSLKEEDIQHLIICDGSADWNMSRNIQVATNIDRNSIGQFSGLYDKNGKAIYESDILKAPPFLCMDNDLVVCEYVDNSNRVNEIMGLALVNCDNEIVGSDEWDEFEVLGNKYENPNLLEVKK